jgi:hypothetical protein
MSTALAIAALILAVCGALAILQGSLILGIVLIGFAFFVGPGGWSIARRSR